MAKPPKNHGKPWTDKDLQRLKKLATGNTPTRLIGYKMGRTEAAVYGKASAEQVSLKPTNQSPYGPRRKK